MRLLLRVRRSGARERPAYERIPVLAAPALQIQWSSRFADFRGNLRVCLEPSRVSGEMLRGFQIPLQVGSMRPRSFATSLAAHVALVTLLAGIPALLGRQRAPTPAELAAMKHRKLTWYYFNEELPAISPQPDDSGAKEVRRSEKGGQQPGPAPRGVTAPELPQNPQVIISNPPRPDNARQTIVQPDAPDIRIEHDVRVPNVVMWGAAPQRPALAYLPAPDIQISQAPRLTMPLDVVRPAPPVDLVKRDVAEVKAPRLGVTTIEPPAPDAPNLENRISSLKVAAAKALERAPSLEVPTGTTAQITQSAGGASAKAEEAPDLAPPAGEAGRPSGSSTGSMNRLIALGVNPAPPGGAISVPPGNRAGSFSTGPAGQVASKTPGTPYGSLAGLQGAGAGGPAPAGDGTEARGPATSDLAAIRVPGLSISGGVRPPSAAIGPVVSGPPAPVPPPPPAPKPAANPGALAALAARAARPDLLGNRSPESLPEWGRMGDRRQPLFMGKRVYTVYINMPNLSSQSGSWIMRFAELADRVAGATDPELAAPVALRKVDPGYHPDAIREKLEGVVVLYAVIHRDGRVDSVRVVRGLDPRLDERAVSALLRWQFQPATRNGAPVDLEALVQIPFSYQNGKPF